MSTKFNNAQNLQPTPKICAKGPEGWRYDAFNFHTYPLQSFVSWYQPITPWHCQISGIVHLVATPTFNVHGGVIGNYYSNLEVDLVWWPAAQNFTLTVQFFKQTVLFGAASWTFDDPQPGNPFETELFIRLRPDPSPARVECKVYS